MTTRCLYILLITTASQLFATGGMWDGKWETELIPDFSTSPGVDDMAVPSVIVAGAVAEIILLTRLTSQTRLKLNAIHSLSICK